MKYKKLFLAAFPCLILACSSTTMVESTYDPLLTKHSSKVYSKYYDAGDWLVPNNLGASVVADHMKRRIPVIYGVQQSLGALGPGDSYAQAKITIYLWNFGETSQAVTDIQLSSSGQSLKSETKVITALPKARTKIDLGIIDIFDGGKNIPVTVTYMANGKKNKLSLDLIRRTNDELKAFYAPSGRLPYPWHSRIGELR
jgi:hypothetical protein